MNKIFVRRFAKKQLKHIKSNYFRQKQKIYI